MTRPAIVLLVLALLFNACDQKLSEKQREAFKEEMEDREIKKISQDEIYKKAMEEGRLILGKLDSSTIADLVQTCKCNIELVKQVDQLSGKSKEVFEAYTYDSTGEDNVQKNGMEALIYSKPNVVNDSLQGVWFITFDRKEIIKML